MFIEVEHEDLIVGEKYKINSSTNFSYFTGILKENFVENDRYIQCFDRVIFYPNCITKEGVLIGYNKHMCLCYYAYVSQKERIQQTMEQRALDKILKRLVNDDFSW
jgi:hypothetical protein